MGKKIITIILCLAVLGIVFFCSTKIIYSQDLYRVNHGTSEQIDVYDVCQVVENNCGKDILVPVKTSEEWAEFRIHAPSNIPGISLVDCGCGSDITFTYKGSSVTYGTVESQGKCWMDRNLGASRVATAYNDSQAYGDLFQWGRCDDGHQNRGSAAYIGRASTYTCEGGNAWDGDYIRPSSDSDWLNTPNDNLWQGVSGINNPCPSGWRIPTKEEWEAELNSWSSQDYNGAFDSPLKLTAAGYRDIHGSVEVGSRGHYWCSTVDSTLAWYLSIRSNVAFTRSHERSISMSVRCIQD